jgi:hypothetical protein
LTCSKARPHARRMASTFIFPGTPRERRDLAAAVAHNCACFVDDQRAVRCAAHTMALGETPADRRALEGLLYVRRVLLPKLRAQEFSA